VPEIALENDPEGLPLLMEWLKSDPELRRARLSRKASPPGEDEMGAVWDVIQVALGPESIVPALASSLSTWAISRRRTLRLRINGHTVDVSGSSDPDKLAAELAAKLLEHQ
jgi:hypothetical protein